jgi:ACS family 4-hydroxyphenylacetate permease-like MFS transporter
LVGITEAGFLPGVLLYMTFWFPAAYRARANALFMIAMPFTAGFGSVLSGAILGLDGHWGLAGWQWLFLLEGLPSVLLGLAVYGYLDDQPRKAHWLSDDEKLQLAELIERDRQVPSPNAHWGRELLSPSVILFCLVYFCLVNTLAMIAVWTPLIVKSFSTGQSNTLIGLLSAIPQICTIIGMILWGRHSDLTQERRWHLALPMLLAATGWCCTALSSEPIVQLAGVCMAATGSYTAMSIFWTLPDRSLSFQARAVGIAVINAVGNLGSALNPLVVGWLKDLTHTYTAGCLYAALLLLVAAMLVRTLPHERQPSSRELIPE